MKTQSARRWVSLAVSVGALIGLPLAHSQNATPAQNGAAATPSHPHDPMPLAETVGAHPAAGFAGDWTGQLQTPSGTHPARLNIRVSSDQRALILTYSSDDSAPSDTKLGNPQPSSRHLMLTFFPQAASATVSTDGEHESTYYALSGFDDLARTQQGTLTLTSPASRLTITLAGNQLTWRQEARTAGSSNPNDPFVPKETYSLNRTTPAN